MAWLNFGDKSKAGAVEEDLSDMIAGWSIEVMPRTAEVRIASARDMVKTGPYKSPRAYARAVKEAGGEMPAQSPFID